MEQWKDIKGYEGYYQISNYGNIKSVDRIIWNGHVMHKRYGAPVKQKEYRYKEVLLCKDGKATKKYMHRLVAETFIKNEENKKTVNHKDGNKYNNHVDNLEWATHSENINHAYENGLRY